jgi:hypothetical protein
VVAEFIYGRVVPGTSTFDWPLLRSRNIFCFDPFLTSAGATGFSFFCARKAEISPSIIKVSSSRCYDPLHLPNQPEISCLFCMSQTWCKIILFRSPKSGGETAGFTGLDEKYLLPSTPSSAVGECR